MNLMHLKYASEIAKTGSLNRAADKLFMGQPNLSRAIKELESSLGITIFDRSTKGMVPTPAGEEFLRFAEKILHEVEEIEKLYQIGCSQKQHFSISVPRASYISHAFAKFSKSLDPDLPAEIFYKETNSMRAIKNILEADYHLGIVRYAAMHERYFKDMLEDKGMVSETITEFSYCLLMSKDHPLAVKQELCFEDLRSYIEIAHADPYVPSLPMAIVRKEELPENMDRRIFVFERASQFELLSSNTDTFMWVSPVPEDILRRFDLVQRLCPENTKTYKDMLIHRKDYELSPLDSIFISDLMESKRQHLG